MQAEWSLGCENVATTWGHACICAHNEAVAHERQKGPVILLPVERIILYIAIGDRDTRGTTDGLHQSVVLRYAQNKIKNYCV